ncbi:MAG: hypothetical protein FJ279_14415, partial [Planctomycetes bacterium]|nr:hypothetical protein [Planctomycetota bacterium]
MQSLRVLRVAVLALFWSAALGAEERSFVPEGETAAEPYVIERPAEMAAGKRYPLIVFLHGRGGDHKKQWLMPPLERFRQLASQRGYMLLSPYLGSDHWMNARARRVLCQLLDLILKAEPVDRQRVFVMGMSMGGGGALTFAAHHPDRVRGVCDIFGVTDFTQFYNSKRYQESLSKAFGG